MRMFSPTGEGRFVDVEARGSFPFCQHSAIPQSVIARAQVVALNTCFGGRRCIPHSHTLREWSADCLRLAKA